MNNDKEQMNDAITDRYRSPTTVDKYIDFLTIGVLLFLAAFFVSKFIKLPFKELVMRITAEESLSVCAITVTMMNIKRNKITVSPATKKFALNLKNLTRQKQTILS